MSSRRNSSREIQNWHSLPSNNHEMESEYEDTYESITLDSHELAVQQMEYMQGLELIGWNGGEDHYQGAHCDFCFVCGSPQELFSCQTCNTSYHAACMTPTMTPEDVPTYWFCPHCVLNQHHIPPPAADVTSGGTVFALPPPPPPPPSTATSSGMPVYPLPLSVSAMGESPGNASSGWPSEGIVSRSDGRRAATYTSEDAGNVTEKAPLSQGKTTSQSQANHQSRSDVTTPSSITRTATTTTAPEISFTTTAPTSTTTATKPIRGRPPSTTPHGPSRKKSKYSILPKEVEKALSVIHTELERAATKTQSDATLDGKMQALEQQVRMLEGQLQLTTRELEGARERERERRDLGRREEERERVVGVEELRRENEVLREEVQRRDEELRSWRGRLRELIAVGGE